MVYMWIVSGHPMPGHLPPGMHPGYNHPLYPSGVMVSQPAPSPGAPNTTATSELRAALATPSKLHQQAELARLQSQGGMRPVAPHGPEHQPPMVGHPRVGYPYPELRGGQGPPGQPKTSPSADSKGHPFPDMHPGKEAHGGSAFTQLTQDRPGMHPAERPGMPPHGEPRPGMPHHGDVRPGMPPHGDVRPPGMPGHGEIRPGMYPGDVRFPPPGMYPTGGMPLGIARMGLPGRMFQQHPDMFPQGPLPLPGLLHTQIPMGMPMEHMTDRPPSARPPSNQSSQPSPRPAPSTPSPVAAGHPSPISGAPHHPGAMAVQQCNNMPASLGPRPGVLMAQHPNSISQSEQIFHIISVSTSC